jgi:hypothetical protein
VFGFFPGRGDSNNKPCASRFKHLYDHGLLATVSSLAQEGGELTRSAYSLHRPKPTEAFTASQRSLHNAPIFRLLLKVAGALAPNCQCLRMARTHHNMSTTSPIATQMCCQLALRRYRSCGGYTAWKLRHTHTHVGRSSQAYFLLRNSAMDDSIGGS